MTEEIFIQKVKEHEGVIKKLLYLYINNPEDKKDLYQEIVLQAWKSIERFRGQSKFSTWLYRLSLNTILTFMRRDQRLPKTSLDESLPLHEELIGQSENSSRLLQAIKKLNNVDKTIITLHLDDYNNEEICEIMGISKNNVGVKLHRIKEQLKTPLQNG